jgi:DNA-binding SARP family transcriptional activator
MDYRVLGPLEVRDGDRVLSLGGPRRRTLLAVLLTRPNEVVSVERLADVIWNGDPPAAAGNVVQGHVSDLRKALGRAVISTRAGGYELVVEPERIDLRRFERLIADGTRALTDGRPAEAAERLRDALALWRGPAFADIADNHLLRAEVARIEELRLLALERRVEADLALGLHAEVAAELEAFVVQHPLRERPQAQLMVALYRSGRQGDALEVYRRARQAVVGELGLEPSPLLQGVERAILRHDPALELAGVSAPGRSILVVALGGVGLDGLLTVAEPIARRPPREVIIAATVSAANDLAHVTAQLSDRRERLGARGVVVRTAAFGSIAPGEDAVRLASEQGVELLLVEGHPSLLEEQTTRAVLLEAPCDVGVLFGRVEPPPAGPVLVPFAGADHDWSALELGAWIAASRRVPLQLAGLEGAWRDASRLLASASLAVQRVVGVTSEPRLVPPGPEGLLAAADDAALIVIGVSERWRREGLGRVRLALAEQARPPVLVVRRGLRPGGLAPNAALTRFTWSLRGA